jgi:hypothetical protein
LPFIRRTKAASLPSTASASATPASLALFTSRPRSSWRTVRRSPLRSRSDSSPTRGGPAPITTTRRSSSRSRASRAVITLVVEAIALPAPAFRSNSTCPVDSSARIAAVAATRGPDTTPCPAASGAPAATAGGPATTSCPATPGAPAARAGGQATTGGPATPGAPTARAGGPAVTGGRPEASTDPAGSARIAASTTTTTTREGLAGGASVRGGRETRAGVSFRRVPVARGRLG